MRKTQEVEGLRFAAATVSPIPLREAAELDNSRFVGVQLQPFGLALGIVLMLISFNINVGLSFMQEEHQP